MHRELASEFAQIQELTKQMKATGCSTASLRRVIEIIRSCYQRISDDEGHGNCRCDLTVLAKFLHSCCNAAISARLVRYPVLKPSSRVFLPTDRISVHRPPC
jgi:hypothetical protein